MNRILLSLIPGLGLPAAFTYMYATTLNFSPLWVWLVTINLTLLALMGKDKLTAQRNAKGSKSGKKGGGNPLFGRTPEFTLLMLTLFGATPAMLVARPLFNHKTTKQEFTYALFGVLTVQLVACVYFWPNLKPYI